MKRIAVFMLLVAFSVVCTRPAEAQRTTTAENMRRSRKEAKEQQKVLKKLSRKQRKAMKKYDKAQRKAAKQANHK
ncbi:MAG TPA: hypothetical protein VKD23_02145 [Terriglobales bacterium]|nr:hypothetical protein [Terriglobales bacterium]